MKKLVFLAAFIAFSNPFFAQKNIWAKGFYDVSTQPRFTFFIQKNDTSQALIHRQGDQNINYLLSIAFEQSENIFWEIGFQAQGRRSDASYFDLKSLPNGIVKVGKYNFGDFTVQFSRNKQRFEVEKGKRTWRYFWGTALDFHHRQTSFSSDDPKFWSCERTYSGLSLSLMPRIQRMAGKRMYLELAPHFSVLDLGFESEFIANPELTTRQQHSNYFDLSVFENIGFRFGLGWRLNKLDKTAAWDGKTD